MVAMVTIPQAADPAVTTYQPRTPKQTAFLIDDADGLPRLASGTPLPRLKGRPVTIDVEMVMAGGVVASLNIKRWRAEINLKPSDLGLDVMDPEVRRVFVRGVYKLGQRRLLPAKIQGQVDSIENSARLWLIRNSYDLTGVFTGDLDARGTLAFIPESRYLDWRYRIEEYRQKWTAIGNEIADRLEELQAQMIVEYAAAARVAWRDLKGPGVAMPNEWREDFVRAALSHVPPADEIRAVFEFQIIERPLIPPATLEQELAVYEEMKAKRLAAVKEQELIVEKARSEQRVVEEEELALRRRIADKAARNAELHRLRVQKALAEQHAAYDTAKAAMQNVSDFFEGTFRATLAEFAEDVLRSIDDNGGHLVPAKKRKINRMLQVFEDMNVQNLPDCQEKLKYIRQTVAPEKVDAAALTAAMDELRYAGQAAAKSLVNTRGSLLMRWQKT